MFYICGAGTVTNYNSISIVRHRRSLIGIASICHCTVPVSAWPKVTDPNAAMVLRDDYHQVVGYWRLESSRTGCPCTAVQLVFQYFGFISMLVTNLPARSLPVGPAERPVTAQLTAGDTGVCRMQL